MGPFYQCGRPRVEGSGERITTYYRPAECERFTQSEYRQDGQTETFTFRQADGTAHSVSRPVGRRRDGSLRPLCDVYNAQYGLAVSHDGSRFYLSHWEGGVYCFAVQDLSLVWKNSLGSVRDIFTTAADTAVYCASHNHGLVALNAATGEPCGKVPGAEKDFFRLDEALFLVGVKRGAFQVYAFDGLRQLGRIRVADILPDERDWCFRNAWLSDGQVHFDAFVSGEARVFRVPAAW